MRIWVGGGEQILHGCIITDVPFYLFSVQSPVPTSCFKSNSKPSSRHVAGPSPSFAPSVCRNYIDSGHICTVVYAEKSNGQLATCPPLLSWLRSSSCSLQTLDRNLSRELYEDASVVACVIPLINFSTSSESRSFLPRAQLLRGQEVMSCERVVWFRAVKWSSEVLGLRK